MSAFQIGVECTSQVSSWSFRPPPPPSLPAARRPNDSSPVSTGRLNKKSASFSPLLFLPLFFRSSLYSRLLSLFQTGNGSTRSRPAGEESGDGTGECRLRKPFSLALSMKTDDSSALCKVTWQKCTFRRLCDWKEAAEKSVAFVLLKRPQVNFSGT